MITALLIVLFSMSSTSATDLCDDIVATLHEFQVYTELNDSQVRQIAGRCYTDYVEREERLAASEKEDNK